MSSHTFDVFTDNFQFLVADPAADWSDLYQHTSDATIAQMFIQADGYVAVGTVRNFHAPVTLLVADEEPGPPEGHPDRVMDGLVEVVTGQIAVYGLSEDVTGRTVDVPNGRYRARVVYWNLAPVDTFGINGDDRYEVTVWPERVTLRDAD